MSEYIELKKRFIYAGDVIAELLKGGMELEAAILFANNMQTADVVEVKHGRWEKHKTMHGFVYCSACKDVYLDAEWLADGKWGYCPNCGADMRDGGADK